MSIWKICQAYLGHRQKGQIIAFTALLLPFIVAMCGFTVDFGNIYLHKSRLQNAADAAAIAGAYAYADNNEKTSNHPEANKAAEASGKTNHPGYTQLSPREYKARELDGKTYYKVGLTETVPVYFLRYFGVEDDIPVYAEAVAAIQTSSSDSGSSGGGSSIFDNLFSFGSGGFNTTNNLQNPDNASTAQISQAAIYDGNVVNVGADAGTSTYRHVLLTNKARNDKTITTAQQAIDKQDKDGESGYYRTVTTDKTKSLNEQESTLRDKADKDGAHLEWQNGVNLSNYLALANKNDYIYNSSSNFELNIDEKYVKNNRNNNNPLYVVIDNKWGCKLTPQVTYKNGYEDSRPIVFVFTGTGEVTVNPTGNGFFRGIIYAPNGTVKINDNGLHFFGTIAANKIDLGSQGYYTYQSIITTGPSSGSGSSSTPSTGTTSIGLVSPPSGIDWT